MSSREARITHHPSPIASLATGPTAVARRGYDRGRQGRGGQPSERYIFTAQPVYPWLEHRLQVESCIAT